MEFIGWAVRRNDTGEWWHKHERWNKELPTIYKEKRHATCAGKYHISSKFFDVLETVQIKSIVIKVTETGER